MVGLDPARQSQQPGLGYEAIDEAVRDWRGAGVYGSVVLRAICHWGIVQGGACSVDWYAALVEYRHMGRKTVLTYGTYDLLHKGHILLLERARELGDRLIVGLSTDEFNRVKKKECVYPYEDRFVIVSAIKYVDLVIPEERWEQKIEDIKRYGVDVLVMGDDWEGEFDSLREYCEVVYLPRSPGISTTQIKTDLGSER